MTYTSFNCIFSENILCTKIKYMETRKLHDLIMECYFSYIFTIIWITNITNNIWVLKLTFLRALTIGGTFIKFEKLLKGFFHGYCFRLHLLFSSYLHILCSELLPLRTLFAFKTTRYSQLSFLISVCSFVSLSKSLPPYPTFLPTL